MCCLSWVGILLLVLRLKNCALLRYETSTITRNRVRRHVPSGISIFVSLLIPKLLFHTYERWSGGTFLQDATLPTPSDVSFNRGRWRYEMEWKHFLPDPVRRGGGRRVTQGHSRRPRAEPPILNSKQLRLFVSDKYSINNDSNGREQKHGESLEMSRGRPPTTPGARPCSSLPWRRQGPLNPAGILFLHGSDIYCCYLALLPTPHMCVIRYVM